MARPKKTEQAEQTENKVRKPRTKKAAPEVKIEEKPVIEVALEEEAEDLAEEAPIEDPVETIEITEKSANEFVVETTSFLNVRKGPDKKFNSIGKKYTGDVVTVSEQKNGYGKIGPGQWVSMKFLH